ncbi:L-lactate dehydrogenase [Carboxydochorda subterranea]|uniref:L-lactate dehydrogenase n=1 Tax=Carboxydichorda subterranea TaxID=3109565 RepID=A0ABZ1C273_9FIRM|nr:L-lactate dehydrogenase [Limnochorda sp. L945t]WRP18886.1 L-lactate dehydrogenase [Limnochorda sp. L945t]
MDGSTLRPMGEAAAPGPDGGPSPIRPPKVGIVGTGLVGSTIAYTLLVKGPHCELVLVDVNRDKAEGDAMDLRHGMPLAGPMPIRAGDYAELAGADVVILSAGVAQRPGETRLDLLKRNARITTEVVRQVVRFAPHAILLVVTNPVDVLSYVAQKTSGLPPSRVIGSGTLLDTMRLRYLLGEYFGCDPRSVHAYVIGEHGDSEIPVWSLANIAGVRISELGPRWERGRVQEDLARIFEEVRTAAYQIIQRKGATYYGIALAVARLVESILYHQHSVLTVSTLVDGWHGIDDVYLGMPCVVGRSGIERMVDLPLAPEELRALERSASVLKQAISEVLGATVEEVPGQTT